MRINLARNAGFCFGVKRAIDIAIKTSLSNQHVYMLGDIVHNETVVNKIRSAGVIKIRVLGRHSGKNKILLIRAHGVSRKILQRARALGYKIIDATCPMVKEIHKIARKWENKGYKIIVVGEKKHDEVRGIIGQLKKKAKVIEGLSDIPKQKIHKACVVVQSTQNPGKVNEILAALNKRVKILRFFNTICRPTRMKQEEIKTMPLNNDVMIIIGSGTSANTKRLWEISRSLNKKSFWVQSKNDLKSSWFKNTKTAGITAGASTPDETTQDIVYHIKKLKAKK